MQNRSIFSLAILGSLVMFSCSEQPAAPPPPPRANRAPAPLPPAPQISRVRLFDGCDVTADGDQVVLTCEETQEPCVASITADFVPAAGSETVFLCNVPGIDDQPERNAVALVANRIVLWATNTEFVDREDSSAVLSHDLTGDGRVELALKTVEIADLVHTRLTVFRFDGEGRAKQVLLLDTGLGGDRGGFSSAVSFEGSKVQVVRTPAATPNRSTNCAYVWSAENERFVLDAGSQEAQCSDGRNVS